MAGEIYFKLTLKRYRDQVYEHLQLVESYREGDRTRQAVLHSCGNLAAASERGRGRLVLSLKRALGLDLAAPSVTLLDSRHYADLLAVRTLWEDLQLPGLLRQLTQERAVAFDVQRVVLLMVAHRLLGPDSKAAAPTDPRPARRQWHPDDPRLRDRG